MTIQLDAKDTIFFEKELNTVMSKVYEKKYPALKLANGSLVPITSEADPGDETISFKMFDKTGMAKIISSYADDLPISDVTGNEEFAKIRSLGGAFEYSLQEVRRARKLGSNLTSMKAIATRTSIEQLTDKIGWYGDSSAGLFGFLNNPNIPIAIHTGHKIADPLATPQEMYDILADAVINMEDLTNGIEIPNTLLLPVKEFGIISKTRMDSNSDSTVLQFFKQNFPQITKIDWASQLKNVTPRPSGQAGATNCMLIFNSDPEKIRFEIPVVFEQLSAQTKNLAEVVPCHSRVAGIITPYPISISITEEI
jgi:hypothetical protein